MTGNKSGALLLTTFVLMLAASFEIALPPREPVEGGSPNQSLHPSLVGVIVQRRDAVHCDDGLRPAVDA